MADISSLLKKDSSNNKNENLKKNNINLLSLSVVRRDGSITLFKSEKISNAIKKAFSTNKN